MKPWTGQIFLDNFDVKLVDSDQSHIPLRELVGLALRHNPKRAHLPVSTLLGKHSPANPQAALGAGRLLGFLAATKLKPEAISGNAADKTISTEYALLQSLTTHLVDSISQDNTFALLNQQLDELIKPVDAVVLGFAEAATALGAAVAQQLRAPYIHSTRYPEEERDLWGRFEEVHSHATDHYLTPSSNLLERRVPLVLVDDELTTGRTAINTIRELHQRAAHPRYLLASLVDLRSKADRRRMEQAAVELGVRIDVISLSSGELYLPTDLHEQASEFLQRIPEKSMKLDIRRTTPTTVLNFWNPPALKHGVQNTLAHQRLASKLAACLPPSAPEERVLVLGVEEDMYLPLLLACALPHGKVMFGSASRSPLHPIENLGYPIQNRLAYSLPTVDDSSKRFVYNIPENLEKVILMTNSAEQHRLLSAPDSLIPALKKRVSNVIVLEGKNLPEPLQGPQFGSYDPDDVLWLLKDLSEVSLEASLEDREEAIQSGGAHYSEMLPIEYQPSAEYEALFRSALEQNAAKLALAVAAVGEQILAARKAPVLVSLARAGTPIGVLLRRYFKEIHGLDIPHYAISIVRGKGIDKNALNYIASHHDPEQVMFVDGWTGKGAIVRELLAALEDYEAEAGVHFPKDLAVLADPGRCVKFYGTREDYLIPSACLNSTISGLISRTVLRSDLIGPEDYHGGKFYKELVAVDLSRYFIERVASQFASVYEQAQSSSLTDHPIHEEPDFAGWAAVEKISEAYGINNVNLVKPGVGETTRVLLRRVPWKILINSDRVDELRHVRLLAEQRGVEMEQVVDLPYSCIGLIHPRYTKGATGFDGVKV